MDDVHTSSIDMSMDRKLIISPLACRHITAVLSALVMMIGVIVLIGWVFNIDCLKSLDVNWVAVKVNAAICFILCGLSLYIQRVETVSGISQKIAKLLAFLVLLIAASTLYEYIFTTDLGIDQLLFTEKNTGNLYFPGRMLKSVSLNFVFASMALLLLDAKKIPVWINQILIYLFFCISLAGLLSYVFGIERDYYFATYFNMALPTSIGMLLLSISLIFARPHVGIGATLLSDNIGSRFWRGVLPFIFTLPVIIVLGIGIGTKHQIYGSEFQHFLTAFVFITIISIIAYFSAIYIQHDEMKKEQLQVNLWENEFVLQQLIKNMDMVFWRATPDLGKMKYLSPYFEKIWGGTIASFYDRYQHWMDVVLADDRSKFIVALSQLKKDVTSLDLECKILREDGSIRHINNHIFALKDHNGQLIEILGVANDITYKYDISYEKVFNNKIYQIISTSTNIDAVAVNILKLICQSFHYDIGEFWLLDEKKNVLSCLATWQLSPNRISNNVHVAFENTDQMIDHFPIACLKYDRLQYSRHPSHLESRYKNTDGDKIEFKECIGIPIASKHKNIGVLIFYSGAYLDRDNSQYKILMNVVKNLSKYIRIILDETEFSYASQYDLLTGLFNRNGFIKLIDERIKSNIKSFYLIILQINNINIINDTMGYQVGNKITQHIAEILRGICSGDITLSAIGEAKFGLLLSDVPTPGKVEQFTNQLIKLIGVPINNEKDKLYLTANIGIVKYPKDGVSSQTLLQNADLALLQSEKTGGNNTVFFNSATYLLYSNKIQVENKVKNAILNNEFELYYQPKIELQSGRICGVEALIRWQDSTNGIRFPSYFIPICEESDLIIELGDWVLRQSFKDMQILAAESVLTSINLSIRQFSNTYNLVEKVALLLSESKVPAEYVEFEVTETLLMSDPGRTLQVIKQLQKLGIVISLDDFGSKYSSFDYLMKFAPKVIKIDKSFIDNISLEASSRKIIVAMITLAHSLKMKVIAEGAEEALQIKLLREANCDAVQGYYFAKPMPFYELLNLIRAKTKYKLPM